MDIGLKGIAWFQGDGLVGKGAREMLATKTDSLGLLSRAHTVEEKNWTHKLFSDVQVRAHMRAHTHTHKNIDLVFKNPYYARIWNLRSDDASKLNLAEKTACLCLEPPGGADSF